MSGPRVEFVMNCFERNLDVVTAPGYLAGAVAQQEHLFALRTLLINNVSNRSAAEQLAIACVARGEVDRYFFVEDRIDEALRLSKLSRADFGRYLHWSDCCLVALYLDGPESVCYVDGDLSLDGDGDWVSLGLAAFARDARLAVANPNWRSIDGHTSVAREADEAGDGYFIGYGFSDQFFLCRKASFRGRLKPRFVPLVMSSPASARYPGLQLPRHSTLFLEQILDQYMRRRGLMRITFTQREFRQIAISSYPPTGVAERLMARVHRVILAALDRGRRRTGWLSPRLRTTGLLDPAFSPRAAAHDVSRPGARA